MVKISKHKFIKHNKLMFSYGTYQVIELIKWLNMQKNEQKKKAKKRQVKRTIMERLIQTKNILKINCV